MEREVGGGIGMGNTCKPMADSFQCMTKSTTIKKKFLKKRSTKVERLKLILVRHIKVTIIKSVSIGKLVDK